MYRKAREADRKAVASVIIEAFEEEFVDFVGRYGPQVVQTFLANSLRIDCFRLIDLDGEIVAVLAVTDPGKRGLVLDQDFLRQETGWLVSKVITWGMREVMQKLIFNMCIGSMTPPVGSVLFVGCGITKMSIERVSVMLLPYFLVLIAILLVLTYVPVLSMGIPQMMGLV